MIQFLRSLSSLLTEFFRKSETDVDPSEDITRFIFSSKHFSSGNNLVKYGAFIPPKNLKASVYRVSKLSPENIWRIGEEYVAKPQQRTIRARADFKASLVSDNDLQIVPDTKPHPRHADIVGWPEEKSEQKLLAIELANKAALGLPDNST